MVHSAKHLDAYLDELVWRFNNRNNPYLFEEYNYNLKVKAKLLKMGNAFGIFFGQSNILLDVAQVYYNSSSQGLRNVVTTSVTQKSIDATTQLRYNYQ